MLLAAFVMDLGGEDEGNLLGLILRPQFRAKIGLDYGGHVTSNLRVLCFWTLRDRRVVCDAKLGGLIGSGRLGF